MFVLDKVPYSKRKEKGEKAPANHVRRPDEPTNKKIINSFYRTSSSLSLSKFKTFIIYQLENSPEPNKLLDFLELEFIPQLEFYVYDFEEGPMKMLKESYLMTAVNFSRKQRIKVIQSLLPEYREKLTEKDENLSGFQVALVVHYLDASKDYVLKASMSLEDWEDVGQEYGRSATNIRKHYKKIFRLSDYRLKGKTRVDDIKSAIVYMKENKPEAEKAIQLAESELEKSLLYNK